MVRQAAADALGTIGPEAKTAISALAGLLKDTDWFVRLAAGRALGKIGPTAIHVLTNSLKDEDIRVRGAAVEGLIQMGPQAKPAIPALTELLQDKTQASREAAARALKKIQEEKE